MYQGMLWFDGDPRKSLEQKVSEAVAYFREKYGEPKVCYVAPEVLNGAASLQMAGVRVLPLSTVPRHHFLVSWEEEREGAIRLAQELSLSAPTTTKWRGPGQRRGRLRPG